MSKDHAGFVPQPAAEIRKRRGRRRGPRRSKRAARALVRAEEQKLQDSKESGGVNFGGEKTTVPGMKENERSKKVAGPNRQVLNVNSRSIGTLEATMLLPEYDEAPCKGPSLSSFSLVSNGETQQGDASALALLEVAGSSCSSTSLRSLPVAGVWHAGVSQTASLLSNITSTSATTSIEATSPVSSRESNCSSVATTSTLSFISGARELNLPACRSPSLGTSSSVSCGDTLSRAAAGESAEEPRLAGEPRSLRVAPGVVSAPLGSAAGVTKSRESRSRRWAVEALVHGEGIRGFDGAKGMSNAIFASRQPNKEAKAFWRVDWDAAIFDGMGDKELVLETYPLLGSRASEKYASRLWPRCTIPRWTSGQTICPMTGVHRSGQIAEVVRKFTKDHRGLVRL